MTGLAPDDPRHGKYTTYTNYACRCDLCRRANTERAKTSRARRRSEGISLPGSGEGAIYQRAVRALILAHSDEFEALKVAERGAALADDFVKAWQATA